MSAVQEYTEIQKHPGGRPLMYTPSELENKIEEYFQSLLRPVIIKNKVLYDDKGNMVYEQYKPATVTGMALFLGFSGRQALINYQDRLEFMDAITRAKARIEEYAETRLYDKEGFQGARFTLMNNFNWTDKHEVTNTHNINVSMSLEDIDAQIKRLDAALNRDAMEAEIIEISS